MGRRISILLALTPLFGSWAIRGEAQVSAPVLADPHHITSLDNDGPVKEQVWYLIGHRPRDFKIAVVEALGKPTGNRPTEGDRWLRVKPVEVILGHQHEHSYVMSYRRATEEARFEMKRSDRIVAMLIPRIHAPKAGKLTKCGLAHCLELLASRASAHGPRSSFPPAGSVVRREHAGTEYPPPVGTMRREPHQLLGQIPSADLVRC